MNRRKYGALVSCFAVLLAALSATSCDAILGIHTVERVQRDAGGSGGGGGSECSTCVADPFTALRGTVVAEPKGDVMILGLALQANWIDVIGLGSLHEPDMLPSGGFFGKLNTTTFAHQFWVVGSSPTHTVTGITGPDGRGNVFVSGSFGADSINSTGMPVGSAVNMQNVTGIAYRSADDVLCATSQGLDDYNLSHVATFVPQWSLSYKKELPPVHLSATRCSGSSKCPLAAGSVVLAGELPFGGNSISSSGVTGPSDSNVLLARLDAAAAPTIADTVTWVKAFGGDAHDASKATAVTNDGTSIYVTGNYTGKLDFGSPCKPLATPSGATHMFVASIDAKGTCVWARDFGGDGVETPTSMTVIAGSSVIVVGSSSSHSLKFGTDDLPVPAPIFVLALDPSDGHHLESYAYGQNLAGQATSVVGSAGSIWIGGWFVGSDLDFGSGVVLKPESPMDTGFVAELGLP
jgi:hypothetical protein